MSVIIDSWPDIAFVIAVIDTIEELAMKRAKNASPKLSYATMPTDRRSYFQVTLRFI